MCRTSIVSELPGPIGAALERDSEDREARPDPNGGLQYKTPLFRRQIFGDTLN